MTFIHLTQHKIQSMLVKLKHEMLLFHHMQYELNLVQLHLTKKDVRLEKKEKKALFQIQFFEKKDHCYYCCLLYRKIIDRDLFNAIHHYLERLYKIM